MHPLARITATLAVVIAATDAATKALAFSMLDDGEQSGLLLPIRNPQALLGIAPGSPAFLNIAAAALLIVFLGACLRLSLAGRVPRWVPGLLLGGAGANLADRLLTGAVHDFLVIGRTAVVNLADIAVVVALVGYCVGMARTRRTSRQPNLLEHP